MSSSSTFTTTVHPYDSSTQSHTCAYEVGLQGAKNALVFIGGLGDGPYSVPYPRAIAKRLETEPELSYSVFEFTRRSSFAGFGFSRLADDVVDTSALVEYLRSIGRQKVVLMGHSTGSQDCMEYTSPEHEVSPVDAYILQGPCCDRDAVAMEMGLDKLEEAVKAAKDLSDVGKQEERMPQEHLPASFHTTPISVHRWLSLVAKDGEDNYFSPQLEDDVIRPYWKRLDKPVMVLHSGIDEFVPNHVDKEGLIKHWMSLCQPGIASELSGTIPGGNHRVEDPEAEAWLTARVVEFLNTI